MKRSLKLKGLFITILVLSMALCGFTAIASAAENVEPVTILGWTKAVDLGYTTLQEKDGMLNVKETRGEMGAGKTDILVSKTGFDINKEITFTARVNNVPVFDGDNYLGINLTKEYSEDYMFKNSATPAMKIELTPCVANTIAGRYWNDEGVHGSGCITGVGASTWGKNVDCVDGKFTVTIKIIDDMTQVYINNEEYLQGNEFAKSFYTEGKVFIQLFMYTNTNVTEALWDLDVSEVKNDVLIKEPVTILGWTKAVDLGYTTAEEKDGMLNVKETNGEMGDGKTDIYVSKTGFDISKQISFTAKVNNVPVLDGDNYLGINLTSEYNDGYMFKSSGTASMKMELTPCAVNTIGGRYWNIDGVAGEGNITSTVASKWGKNVDCVDGNFTVTIRVLENMTQVLINDVEYFQGTEFDKAFYTEGKMFIQLFLYTNTGATSNLWDYSVSQVTNSESLVEKEAIFGWETATENNLTVKEADGMANFAETKASFDPKDTDVIVNKTGFDVNNIIEFNAKMNNVPKFDGDNHFDIFLSPEYTDKCLFPTNVHDSMKLHLVPTSATTIGGRYWTQNGVHGVGNITAPAGSTWGADVKYDDNGLVNIKIVVKEDKTVVLLNGVEYMFGTEFPKSFFKEGKMYINIRLYNNEAAQGLWDVSVGTVKNDVSTDTIEFKDYKYSNIGVNENADGSISLVNKEGFNNLFYTVPVDTSKRVTIKFKFDNIPGYHVDGIDAWFGLFLSSINGAVGWGSADLKGMLLRTETETQIGGESTSGELKANVVKDGWNTLVFEVQKTKIALILNGVKALGDIDEGFYKNNCGFISFALLNNNFAEGKEYNVTYMIENEGEIVLPQVAVDGENLNYDLASNKDYTLSVTDDFITAITGNEITANDYVISEDRLSVTFKQAFMLLLESGKSYTFKVIADQSEVEFTVSVTGTITQITLNARTFTFDKANPQDIVMTVGGTDTFKNITGSNITANDFTFVNNVLTIKKEFLQQIANGSLEFVVNGEASLVNITVNIEGETVEVVEIVLDKTSATFDNNSKADIVVKVTSGVLVKVVGAGISSTDYTINGTVLTLKEAFLANLENGEYSFKIYGEDDSFATLKVTVSNKQADSTSTSTSQSSGSGKNCSANFVGIELITLITTVAGAALVLTNKKKI